MLADGVVPLGLGELPSVSYPKNALPAGSLAPGFTLRATPDQ
jgi:hypothetical protein